MGTNFYLYDEPPCEHCGRGGEPKHIGKSSAGWCFGLHVIPDEGINNLSDWNYLWSKKGAVIKDEYGATLTPDEMLDRIIKRKWKRRKPDKFDYAANHAIPGPNGLVRHAIGNHCLGHGEGTWDLIPGEFS